MKIVFLHKHDSFMAPIGLLQIAAIARQQGALCKYVNMNNARWLDDVAIFKPDVVACSMMTGEAKHYIRAAEAISERCPSALLIAGGMHPTFFPEMVQSTPFHVICRGEGEAAFKTMLRDWKAKNYKAFSLDEITQIPNLVTTKTPNPFSIPMYELEHDLDSLPPPAWDLLYDNSHLGANPLKIYMTGRGCPFNCPYCYSASWRGLYSGNRPSSLRKHSVDYIMTDLERIRSRWNLKYVKFYDDVFVTKLDDWFCRFMQQYRERIGLPFFVLMRAEHMTMRIARWLKRAGCQCVSMSIEANEGTRRLLLNRNMSDDVLIEAHRICEKVGLETFTNVIVGLPDTPIESDIEALRLAAACHVSWVEFPIFEPYPRTELGDYTFSRDYADEDWQSIHTSYQYRSRLTCFTESEKDVQVNLGSIGVLAVLYPRWREFILNWAIYRKPNRLFLLAYWAVKMKRMTTRIYPTGLKWYQRWRIYLRSLKQELWRHSKEK